MIEQDIRRIVGEHGAIPLMRLDALGADDSLFANGLRSFDTVQIMLALEERFAIEFPDTMLNRANFASVAAIRSSVERLLGGGAAA